MDKKIRYIGLILAVMLISCTSGRVYAKSSLEEINEKTRLQALAQCMDGKAALQDKKYKANKTSIPKADFNTLKGNGVEVAKTVKGNYEWYSIFPFQNDNPDIYLPTKLTSSEDSMANCYQILTGTGVYSNNILAQFGVDERDYATVTTNNYFTGMGYDGESSESGSTEKCLTFSYAAQSSVHTNGQIGKRDGSGFSESGSDSSEVCFDVNSEGIISGNLRTVKNESASSGNVFSVEMTNEGLAATINGGNSDGKITFNGKSYELHQYGSDNDVYGYQYFCNLTGGSGYIVGQKYEDVTARLASCLKDGENNNAGYVTYEDGYNGHIIQVSLRNFNVKGGTNSAGKSSTYTISSNAGSKAVKYISGRNNVSLNRDDEIILYQYYIKTVMGANIVCDPDSAEYKNYESTNKAYLWYVDASTVKNCYIDYGSNYLAGEAIFSASTGDSLGRKVTIDEIIELHQTKVTDAYTVDAEYSDKYFGEGDGSLISTVSEEANDISSDSSASEPSCWTTAGALGWIICPVLNGISEGLEGFYEQFIEGLLVIQPEFFNSNVGSTKTTNGGVYAVWSSMRIIANLVFIVCLFIIILSQITGLGISNYGIKKMLPNLIVGIILINLSYIICQIAIDLSNIVGLGVEGLFEGVMDDVDWSTVSVGESNGVGLALGNVGTFLGTAIITFFITKGWLLMNGGGWGFLMAILAAALTAVVALIALWLTLFVRKALAVILVIVSPLAFACYMFPNLKKTFDLWFKMFKGLLIAFPVCSLMIYGGQLVGKILVLTSGGSVGVCLAGAVVSIVPVFFIPKTVSSSLGMISGMVNSGIGGLSKKLNGAGNTALSRTSIAARSKLNKSAADRILRDTEYKAAKRQAAASKGKSSRMHKSLYTEANRVMSGYARAEEQPEIDAITLQGQYEDRNGVKHFASYTALMEEINELNKGKKGKVNEARMHAAISHLQQNNSYSDLNNALLAINQEGLNQLNLGGKYSELGSRVKQTLISDKENNAAAAYYAKKGMDDSVTFRDYMNNSFEKEAQKGGANLRGVQDDSTIEWMRNNASGDNWSDKWTNEQLAYGSDNQKHAASSVDDWRHMNGESFNGALSQMTAEQLAKKDIGELSAMGQNSCCNSIRNKLANESNNSEAAIRYRTAIAHDDEMLASAVVGVEFLESINIANACSTYREDTGNVFRKSMTGDMAYVMGLGKKDSNGAPVMPNSGTRGSAAKEAAKGNTTVGGANPVQPV